MFLYCQVTRSSAYPPASVLSAGYQISCGATSEQVAGNVTWFPDGPFVHGGEVAELGSPGVMMPMLSSLRYFPDASAGKHCYVVPAARHARYLVRTTYYEAVVEAAGKELSVCLARSRDTAPGRSPFISALQVVPLEASVYGAVNFTAYALSTIARHSFGGRGGCCCKYRQ